MIDSSLAGLQKVSDGPAASFVAGVVMNGAELDTKKGPPDNLTALLYPIVMARLSQSASGVDATRIQG